VRTTDGHLVVTVGVEDLIVVHTDDATLVARRDSEGRLGEIVKQLDSRGWREYL
jgi:mannose-1-phosphate guanylyltransferase